MDFAFHSLQKERGKGALLIFYLKLINCRIVLFFILCLYTHCGVPSAADGALSHSG